MVTFSRVNPWGKINDLSLIQGIDRIKLISTYREYEVAKNKENLEGTVSDGTPDLRPKSHIPYLEEKLGVSKDALYLWCLRLCTDRFLDIINDDSDPTINRLQVEVRYWTTRQRIRFKADVTQALVNAMAFAHFIRTGNKDERMPELTPNVLYDYLESLYFVGVDPSCQHLMPLLKENWCNVGRPSTHYYQGFRELRWESVKKSISLGREMLFDESTGARKETKEKTSLMIIKEMIEKLVLRDGFKIGGEASYIIENWENCRYAQEDLVREAVGLLDGVEGVYKNRILDSKAKCQDKWMANEGYSPDRAEILRKEACEKMFEAKGVKV